MAEILNIGFRTFVRYEVGERAIPVSILIKTARMGNVSLEELMTLRLSITDVNMVKVLPSKESKIIVRKCDFKKGQIFFCKPFVSKLISRDDSEKKILRLFRQMNTDIQQDSLFKLESMIKLSKINPKAARERMLKEVESCESEYRFLVGKMKLNRNKLKTRKKPGRKKVGSMS
tara:strand:- start:413 stop:934 length:522 start_codon:yes stop_codon:yes gene_type:complete